MKAFVTGGAGFIGSHIGDLLLEKGYEVCIVDNLSTGRKENVNKDAVFYELDICDMSLGDIFEKENPDFVVHEAAQINVRKSIQDPIFDAQTNISGSLNLLECCKKYNVKKVVYASSGGAVYGEPQYLPADEKHPIAPLCPYGISKYATELHLHSYNVNFGMEYTILRYSNVYGPRQDPAGEAGVIAIFTKKLLKNEQTVINGDGKQTRDFVYVEDVAEANLLAIEKKTENRVFNIGSGVETSINELTDRLARAVGIDVKPSHREGIKGEVQRIYLNIERAERELKWKPKIDLKTGLEKTVSSIRED